MTDQTNQCPQHGETVLCLTIAKNKIEKLEADHKKDIADMEKKTGEEFRDTKNMINNRIPNQILIPILAAMCIFGLYLFDGASESRGEIRKATAKNMALIEDLKDDLKDEILPSLARIESRLNIPEPSQIIISGNGKIKK